MRNDCFRHLLDDRNVNTSIIVSKIYLLGAFFIWKSSSMYLTADGCVTRVFDRNPSWREFRPLPRHSTFDLFFICPLPLRMDTFFLITRSDMFPTLAEPQSQYSRHFEQYFGKHRTVPMSHRSLSYCFRHLRRGYSEIASISHARRNTRE